MFRSNHLVSLKKRLAKTCIAFCLVVALASFAVQVPSAFGVFSSRIVFYPEFGRLLVGQNFTLVVNLQNFANLFGWEVVLRYNGTVLNLTSIWIPNDNVFGGHGTSGELSAPAEYAALGDSKDGLNWTDFGTTLLGAFDGVSVTNGTLCVANFTVIGTGECAIKLATTKAPVFRLGRASYWSSLEDTDLNSWDDFIPPEQCTILCGVRNAVPTASYSVLPPPSGLNDTYYVLSGQVSPGLSSWQLGYLDFPTVFNASESMDPDGYITRYIWDFGDGNITAVDVNYTATGNATIDIPAGIAAARAASVISHDYESTGVEIVRLIVTDNGNPDPDPDFNAPPTNSTPSGACYVYVGLLLVPYDWNPFIYAVAAIVAVLIVVSAARRTRVFIRQRRELAKAKVKAGSQNKPPSTTNPPAS